MGYLAARLGPHQPTKVEREQLIHHLCEAILKRCSPLSIKIFGSILGEDFTHASDIDCALIFQDRRALDDARKELYRQPPLVDRSYDLLLYVWDEFERRAKEGGICQVISESGRTIYDQEPKV